MLFIAHQVPVCGSKGNAVRIGDGPAAVNPAPLLRSDQRELLPVIERHCP